MDEDRVTGTAKHVGGKIEEDFGRITTDTQAQIKRHAKQSIGKRASEAQPPRHVGRHSCRQRRRRGRGDAALQDQEKAARGRLRQSPAVAAGRFLFGL